MDTNIWYNDDDNDFYKAWCQVNHNRVKKYHLYVSSQEEKDRLLKGPWGLKEEDIMIYQKW